MKKHLLIKLLFSFFVGCLTSKAQTNIIKGKKVSSLISKKREYNKVNGIGFRIQLYNGKESKAREIKSNFEREFPNTFIKLNYIAPEWKVEVGNYINKLDADRALNEFRKNFANAIIIPL